MKAKCAHCGTNNELNRVFCLQCGNKLNLAKAIAENRRGGGGRFILSFLRTAVAFLILSATALMLWPVEPRGALGLAVDARKMSGTFRLFHRAIQNQVVIDGVVTEAEVNGYLAKVLRENSEALSSKGFRLGIRDINVAFTRENFVVLVLANWGSVVLSYEITAVASVKSGRFVMIVKKVRWGHLPLPDPAASWLSRRVAGIFLRMEKELAVLNSLGRFELGNGRVYIATRGE